MGFFKKKKNFATQDKTKSPVENKNHISLSEEEDLPLYLLDGKGDLWDVLSPDGIDLNAPNIGYLTDSLQGKRPFKPVYVTRGGWPRKLQTDWISKFFSAGEVDVTIYLEKIPSRQAVRSLKKMLTILQSNLRAEQKRGNIDQLHDIQTKIADTEALMEDIALGENDHFHVSVQACIYAQNENELETLSTFLEDELGGSFIHLRTAYDRIQEGYLSVLPRGVNLLNDTYRNLDRRSLSTLFPFASSELKYKGGIPFGVNQGTNNLVFLNLFADDHMNYNMVVFGESGSGKTFAIETLVARNLITGTHIVILDPEGEYKKMTKRLGGVYIKLGNESPVVINPCALSVTEVELDDEDDEIEDGREIVERDGKMYVRFVPIKEKLNELLQFFNMLVQNNNGEKLDSFEELYLQEAILQLLAERGITSDPNSLYEEKAIMVGNEIHHDRVLKEEITISDIYNKLKELYGEESRAERLIAAIRPWLRDGARGLFDGQTYFGADISSDIDHAKIVTFDISDLEEGSILRLLSYHVALTWIWQKFVKSEKNAFRQKIVVADEFWQMVDSEQTVSFAEKMARRCRKRNTSFVIASQDAKRILENRKAYGVVTNSSIQFLLKQNSVNYSLMKEAFNLSDGEASIIMGEPKKGEGILRVQNESVWVRTDPTDYEKILFESNRAKMKQLEMMYGSLNDLS